MVTLTLSYTGGLADNNMLDMYDAARGLASFHRSLALATHLVLNGEIITQAPALRGAQIISRPPEDGSWKATAVILAGIWAGATASKDSVAGHLIVSGYDYAVSSAMGFHVDFEKTLGQQYEEHLARKKITPEKLDSLIEKIEPSLADMHRPIVASETATQADILDEDDILGPTRVDPHMTKISWEYLAKTEKEQAETVLDGKISSFNVNTYKGRIFVYDEARPIPFELASDARTTENVVAVASSLRASAANRLGRQGGVRLRAQRLLSSTGRLKGMIVKSVEQLAF